MTRTTKETDIALTLSPDGGAVCVDTGIGFLDHMLTAMATHGGMGLTLTCRGDLAVDMHHTTEDCGIVLGQALAAALGDKKGIARFGQSFVPMDEALAFCSLDLSGRPYLVCETGPLEGKAMDGFDPMLLEEFFRALAVHGGITLHLACHYGRNPHHIAEALFKALGRALWQAVRIVGTEILSTKGTL